MASCSRPQEFRGFWSLGLLGFRAQGLGLGFFRAKDFLALGLVGLGPDAWFH